MESRNYSINVCWMKCINERGGRGQCRTHNGYFLSQTLTHLYAHIHNSMHPHRHHPYMYVCLHTLTNSAWIFQCRHHILIYVCTDTKKTLYSHHHTSTHMDNTETTHTNHTHPPPYKHTNISACILTDSTHI